MGGEWLPVLVGLLTAAAFLPSLSGGFLNFDDEYRFLKNKAYMGLGWTQLRWIFAGHFDTGNYEPFTWLTMAVVHALRGVDAAAYHLPGYLAHVATAVLFYFVSLRLLASALPPGEGETPRFRYAAAFAALLFGAHPLRTEVVAWLSGQHYTLAGAFFLASLNLYLRAFDAGNRAARAEPARGAPRPSASHPGMASPACYWGSAALFAVSILFYPIGMPMPVILLIIDAYPLRRLSWSRAAPPASPVLREKIPFLLLSLVGCASMVASRKSADLMAPIEMFGWAQRVTQTGYGLTMYLLETLDPVHFEPHLDIFKYGFDFLQPAFVGLSAASVAFTVAALALRRRWPGLLAVWACYVAALLPVSGLAQSGNQIIADRYTYLACLGWPLLAAASLIAAARTPGLRRLRPWGAAAAVAAVVGLEVLSFRQCRVWRDSGSFWTHHLRLKADDPYYLTSMAAYLAEIGDYAMARDYLQRSLKIDPSIFFTEYTLGFVHSKMGDHAQALKYFHAALSNPLSRRLSIISNAVGASLAQLGRHAEAVEHLAKAVEISPDNVEARFNLGISLLELGRVPEALGQFRQAAELYPGYWEAHFNAGTLLAGQGRFDEAMRHYRSALSVKPGHPEVLNNLGVALLKTGRAAEAQARFEEILRSQPGHARARFNLARARAAQGRPAD
ncbi:MAG: tetratricopeptide repeat protein [Elusimicrobia bacterium]|nr:tetratricopeptide repeat protein [Elusimicrobiota bacterium]